MGVPVREKRYFSGMFVRKKKNKSGSISIQVIDKTSGKYKVLKTIGSSEDKQTIAMLFLEGQQWIRNYTKQLEFDIYGEKDQFDKFLSGIQEITVIGDELLLGKIFDEIGFNQIKDKLFRQLVLSRLCYPSSKLRTTDYL